MTNVTSRLKEAYLSLLFLTGCFVPFIVFIHHPHHFEVNLLTVTISCIVIGLFPILFPGNIARNTTSIFYILGLYQFGLTTACGIILVGSLAVFIRLNDWNIFKIRWFRYFASLGMYLYALIAAAATDWMLARLPIEFRVILSMLAFEIANFLLYELIMVATNLYRKSSMYRQAKSFSPLVLTTAMLSSFVVSNTASFSRLLLTILLMLALVLLARQFFTVYRDNRDLEEKYELIANNASDLILIVAQDLEVIYASPSFQRAFHEPVREGDLRPYLTSDATEKLQEAFVRVRNTGLPQQIELEYVEKNRVLYTETAISPVARERQDISHFVISSRDISERVAQQEYIVKTEKLAVVGELAAGIAHEIRNPLTAIRGYMQMLKPELDHVSESAFSVVWSEVSRIEEITTDLLLLAKPQHNEFRVVDLSDLMSQCVALMSAQAHKENVQIHSDITKDIFLWGRPNQLRTLAVNLIKNAVESMKQSGTVTVSVHHNQNEIQFTVEDEGVGMPAETIARAGEPFYTTKATGTGLGLMVVQRVVADHGGTMQISSQLDVGTRIEIRFPEMVV